MGNFPLSPPKCWRISSKLCPVLPDHYKGPHPHQRDVLPFAGSAMEKCKQANEF